MSNIPFYALKKQGQEHFSNIHFLFSHVKSPLHDQ